MKALVLDGSVQLREWPTGKPGVGEALVRVRMAGICATDLHLIRGYYPFHGVLGHEFVGEIVDAPDAPWRLGERVVGEINIPCGGCAQCRAGRPNHCEYRQVLGIKGRDGAFAESLLLPLTNLHKVPDGVSDQAAVFTEPLAAALEIPRQTPVPPDEKVLVVGAGRLGQLIARVLKLSGCGLQVVIRHQRQRELLDQAGIAWLYEDDVEDGAYDLVVEAGGSPASFQLARLAVRPGGRMVLKSTYPGDMALNFSSLVVDEITLVGSRCGPFPPALRLLDRGLVDPAVLIGEVLPLGEGIAALDKAARPGAMKVLLDMR